MQLNSAKSIMPYTRPWISFVPSFSVHCRPWARAALDILKNKDEGKFLSQSRQEPTHSSNRLSLTIVIVSLRGKSNDCYYSQKWFESTFFSSFPLWQYLHSSSTNRPSLSSHFVRNPSHLNGINKVGVLFSASAAWGIVHRLPSPLITIPSGCGSGVQK